MWPSFCPDFKYEIMIEEGELDAKTTETAFLVYASNPYYDLLTAA